MSAILERALAPVLVALVWLVAIFTLSRGDAGGLESVFAGLIGGAALILQACAVGVRGVQQVLGLRAPVAAAGSILMFLVGVALGFVFEPRAAAMPFLQIADIALSVEMLANVAMRIGIALAVAATIAQAGIALFDETGA